MSGWIAGGLVVNQIAGDPVGLDLTGADAAADALSSSSAASSKVLQEGTLAANNQLYSSYDKARGYLDPYMEGGQNAYQQYLLNLGGDSVETEQTLKWGDLDHNQQSDYMRLHGGERPSVNDMVVVPSGLTGAGQTANLAPTWDEYLDPNNVDPGAFNYEGGLDPGEFNFWGVADPGRFNYEGGLDPGQFNFEEGGFEFDPSTVTLDEGWKWRQAEGQQAIDRELSALGLSMSGGAVKEAIRYNQGFLSNEYATAYERQYGQAQDEYASRYGLATDIYNSQLDEYQRDYSRDFESYGTAVDAYGRKYGEAQYVYDTQVDAYQRDYGRETDAYGTAVDTFGRVRGANMEDYNMDYGSWQDMMNQLGGVASQGMATSGSLADLAMNYGYGYGNNIMTGAGANASNLMNQGSIGANLATSGWNSAMDIAGLGVQAYTGYQMGQSENTGQEVFDLENW